MTSEEKHAVKVLFNSHKCRKRLAVTSSPSFLDTRTKRPKKFNIIQKNGELGKTTIFVVCDSCGMTADVTDYDSLYPNMKIDELVNSGLGYDVNDFISMIMEQIKDIREICDSLPGDLVINNPEFVKKFRLWHSNVIKIVDIIKEIIGITTENSIDLKAD